MNDFIGPLTPLQQDLPRLKKSMCLPKTGPLSITTEWCRAWLDEDQFALNVLDRYYQEQSVEKALKKMINPPQLSSKTMDMMGDTIEKYRQFIETGFICSELMEACAHNQLEWVNFWVIVFSPVK